MLVGNKKRRYREIGESLDSKVRVCESLNLTPTRSIYNLRVSDFTFLCWALLPKQGLVQCDIWGHQMTGMPLAIILWKSIKYEPRMNF